MPAHTKYRAAQSLLAGIVAFIMVAGGACSSSPSDAAAESGGHWLVGDDDIPTYEYVAHDERTRRLVLVAELVIGERPGDANYAFGEQAPTLAIDDDGRFFVFDAGNYRIKVFDAEGEFQFAFGGRGEGPGEFPFARRGRAGFLGDRLFVFYRSGHTGLWNTSGELVGLLRHRLWRVGSAVGTDDGQLVASANMSAGNTGRSAVFARYQATDTGFEEVQRYALIPPWGRPNFSGTRSGDGFATVFDVTVTNNDLIAFGRDGNLRWIARTAWPVGALPGAEIVVDGNGRIYVFPAVDRGHEVIERPVDVYSPEGQRIASAMMRDILPSYAWQHARGDFIYGVEANPMTFEWQVIRYRLAMQ